MCVRACVCVRTRITRALAPPNPSPGHTLLRPFSPRHFHRRRWRRYPNSGVARYIFITRYFIIMTLPQRRRGFVGGGKSECREIRLGAKRKTKKRTIYDNIVRLPRLRRRVRSRFVFPGKILERWVSPRVTARAPTVIYYTVTGSKNLNIIYIIDTVEL